MKGEEFIKKELFENSVGKHVGFLDPNGLSRLIMNMRGGRFFPHPELTWTEGSVLLVCFLFGSWQCYPEDGTIVFGNLVSEFQGWLVNFKDYDSGLGNLQRNWSWVCIDFETELKLSPFNSNLVIGVLGGPLFGSGLVERELSSQASENEHIALGTGKAGWRMCFWVCQNSQVQWVRCLFLPNIT